MRERLPLYVGIFGVMALSNAIVPVLPAFGSGPALQGSLYSAYFLGAFATVIPAGLLADRVGRMPVIRAGLVITVASGLMILALRNPLMVIAGRGVEGIGAGLTIASGMAWMNSRPDHERISGEFMASLNLGLVIGLLGSGVISGAFGSGAGILAFTLLSILPAILVFLVREAQRERGEGSRDMARDAGILWLYLSAVILVGSTGAVTALYPAYTGKDPSSLGIIIATMNLATMAAVIVASRLRLPPIRTIRIASIILGLAVLLVPFTPAGFAIVGAIVGFIMIAQLAFLANAGLPQGAVMGSYNAASYAGMTLLPFVSGIIAEQGGFLPAFAVVACLVVLMAPVVGLSGHGPPAAG
jgi:predicted MFS family arabinose efflux permease